MATQWNAKRAIIGCQDVKTAFAKMQRAIALNTHEYEYQSRNVLGEFGIIGSESDGLVAVLCHGGPIAAASAQLARQARASAQQQHHIGKHARRQASERAIKRA